MIKETFGKNELLDLMLDELNVKEIVLFDDNGQVSKKYDGKKTTEYIQEKQDGR